MAKTDGAAETKQKQDDSCATTERRDTKLKEGTAKEIKDETEQTQSKETPVKTTKGTDSKGTPVDTTKEADSKAAPVETKKEAAVETNREAAVETKKEAPVETKKEAPVETKKEAPIETKKEASVETKKEADSKEATVEIKKEAGRPEEAMDTTEATEDVKKTDESKDSSQEHEVKKEEATTPAPEEESDKASQQTSEIKTENGNQSKDEPKRATELEGKIIRQVEYYFGDVNLGRDNFLQGQMKEDNGWIQMEIMFKFNRLRQLTEDGKVVAAALRKSRSGLMEVSEDGLKIRRDPSKALPVHDKLRREDLKSRSIYVKGFPLDMDLDKLQQFFDQFGEIDHIQRRYDGDRKFKGSVFIIFGKTEDAKKFLETDCLKFEDTELLRLFKDEYFKKKTEERKSKREDELKEMEGKKEKREEEDKEAFRKKITVGTVMQLKGLPSDLSVDDLKQKFSEYAEVAWVEYKTGDSDARVRFSIEDKGKEALEKATEADGGSIKVKEQEVEAYVLEGDDEIQFWKTLFQEQRDRKDKSRRGRGKRGRGGRGGYGGPPSKRRRANYD